MIQNEGRGVYMGRASLVREVIFGYLVGGFDALCCLWVWLELADGVWDLCLCRGLDCEVVFLAVNIRVKILDFRSVLESQNECARLRHP